MFLKYLRDRIQRGTEDAMRRELVEDFLIDYRNLCADVGPWQYAADIGAHPDATTRQIAYLAVWRDGPTLRIWADVQRFGAVERLIDAAVAGFAEHCAKPAEL